MAGRLADTGCARVEGDVDGDTSVEGDGGEILVEEGLEEDGFVSGFEEGDEGGVFTWGGLGHVWIYIMLTNLRWRRW